MKARVAVLLFSVFLAVASVGLAHREQGEVQGKQQPALNNPYYLPSHLFKTRFENKNGSIEVLEKFDKLSEHLQFLQDYRIVRYRTRPGTVVLPDHSDAEFLLIVTDGSAIVKVYTEAEDKYPPLILNQFDVLRMPSGSISYTINSGGSQRDEDLEFIKLALPQNNPGQFQDLYPTGNFTPTSYFEVFSKKTLQAAFNAEYKEIKEALWGPEQWKNEPIVELSPRELRSLTKGAKSSSSEGAHVPLTYFGPVPLGDIEPIYLNALGSFHEARPLNKFPPLEHLGIGASYLNLSKGSIFLPHYNRKAIILAYVAYGEGHNEIGSPYPINKQEQQKEEEGYIERLAANVSRGDLYIIPAGYPVAVSASEKSKLKVVEFILNAKNNSRLFLAGKEGNVMKHIDPRLLSKTPEKLEKLLDQQSLSFFVKREEDKSTRKANRVAWSSF